MGDETCKLADDSCDAGIPLLVENNGERLWMDGLRKRFLEKVNTEVECIESRLQAAVVVITGPAENRRHKSSIGEDQIKRGKDSSRTI